jgi:aminobenzoyl-glutamate utilization protein B
MRIRSLFLALLLVVVTLASAISADTSQTRAPATNAASPNGGVDALKRDAISEVDALQTLTQQMVDSIFSFGELGFQEFETSKYLVAILKKNGFTVEEGMAGIPTAWVATWGSGKPVIALGSDIDGIPQASQKPGVAYHDPLVPGAPGHGEGHNSGQAVNITAAIAIKKLMERDRIPGTIRIWPGVAEELDGSKPYFVRSGMFKDVDVCLFSHVASNLGTSWGSPSGTGSIDVIYNFQGESAHAAGAPWRGHSALDAVELMNIGWNYRREHLRLQQRSHYVINNGGDQPNVVPPSASVWYYFREIDYPHLKELWELGTKMAEAAALMTDTKMTGMVVTGEAYPQHSNKAVAEAMYANIQRVGLPQWSEADQTLAKSLQHELKVPEVGLASKLAPLGQPVPEERNMGGGIRRHWFDHVDRADGDAAISGEFRSRSGTQLGERRRDGHSYRAQGIDGWRESAGAHDDRSLDGSETGRRRVGVLQNRAGEEFELPLPSADPARRQTGDVAE